MGTHHILKDGTSYAIKGGTDLIAGTSYQIGGGRTLVNGTAYNIAFAKPCMITISGGGTSGFHYGYVEYNGEKYTSGTLEIEQGTAVDIYLQNGVGGTYVAVRLNGKTVASGYTRMKYTYQVTKNANIKFPYYYDSDGYKEGKYAVITEE